MATRKKQRKPTVKRSATKASSPGRRSLGVPTRDVGPAKIFTSPPVNIEFAGPQHRLIRIDLEIAGIFHGEASYEGRIFFNNAAADRTTPRVLEQGYAGSFHIFGHGGCMGDPGHCEVNDSKRELYDFRAPHPLTPANKRVTVTAALREIAKSNKTTTVTIVPVVTAANELCDTDDVFRHGSMRFVTYDP
jgi:hypothetical protein